MASEVLDDRGDARRVAVKSSLRRSLGVEGLVLVGLAVLVAGIIVVANITDFGADDDPSDDVRLTEAPPGNGLIGLSSPQGALEWAQGRVAFPVSLPVPLPLLDLELWRVSLNFHPVTDEPFYFDFDFGRSGNRNVSVWIFDPAEGVPFGAAPVGPEEVEVGGEPAQIHEREVGDHTVTTFVISEGPRPIVVESVGLDREDVLAMIGELLAAP